MHHPVIYRSVKLLHRIAAYPFIPYVLTQNEKPIECCYEQGITDGNLIGFTARQIFHRKAHTVHLLKNQYHENMEVKS